MNTDETLYKWTGPGGSSPSGGTGQWDLPNGKPGKWWHVEGEIVACRNGLHLCRVSDLLRWMPYDPMLFEAEYKGRRVDGDDKVVVRSARLSRQLDGLNETTFRLFAADCADAVLFLFEREHPHDARPRESINAARAYAKGEIGAAARAAAGAAARDAAWAAARAALNTRLVLYGEQGEAAMYEPVPDIAAIIEEASVPEGTQ